MKKMLNAMLTSLILFSCASLKEPNVSGQSKSSYLIKEIDSINSWYVIYATKKDSIYKIITKKENNVAAGCKKLELGRSYQLALVSRKNEVPEINGVKIRPVNALDNQCYTYDEKTSICIEPSKGIFDLYHTPSVIGLCYKK